VIAGPNTIVFNGASAQTVNVTAGGGNVVTFSGGVQLDQSLTVNTGGVGGSNGIEFLSPINSGGGTANLALNAGAAAISVQDVGALAALGMFSTSSSVLMLNGAATASQIFISTGEIVPGPNGALNATLPFSGFDGPAALTLSGPATGGIFGRPGGPSNWLLVNAPGLLVVTPNEDRTLPAVWLRGLPEGKPMYQFWDSTSTRPVFWNGPPDVLSPVLQFEELRDTQDLRDSASRGVENLAADLDVRAKGPEVCAPASAEAQSLSCEAPATPRPGP
jgi:hypothetical protein